MPENTTSPRRSLSAVIDLRGREAHRHSAGRMQHQLLGAFTKRP